MRNLGRSLEIFLFFLSKSWGDSGYYSMRKELRQ
nr:MAG TPA: hypothetical protein [Caudoviricetes sp.]